MSNSLAKLVGQQKLDAYNCAVKAGENADVSVDKDIKQEPLKNYPIDDVKFIGGRWRVQKKLNYTIQMVRGKQFVLQEKLPIQEKNRFEYYSAMDVGENCFGYFLIDCKTIVGKYQVGNVVYWAYGATIEQVRAFLGIRLYDEYAGLIHRQLKMRALAERIKNMIKKVK